VEVVGMMSEIQINRWPNEKFKNVECGGCGYHVSFEIKIEDMPIPGSVDEHVLVMEGIGRLIFHHCCERDRFIQGETVHE